MNVNNNDFYSRSLRDIKMPNLRKNSKLSSPNNQRITSPILKTNKTIQKYINEKLSSMKRINNSKNEQLSHLQNKPKINYKNHPNIIRSKLIYSPKQKQSQKQIDLLKKKKKFKEKILIENKSKSKNKEKNNVTNYKSIEHSNKSVNSFLNKKQNIKDSKDLKESKFINSISTSSGFSFQSNENRKCLPFSSKEKSTDKSKKEANNSNIYNNNSSNNTISVKKCNNNMNNDEAKQTIEDTRRYRHNINNFNYESGSDDNMSDNKIYLKCDNYSLLTFGNSFSYSNSQRSKSTKKNGNENIEEYNYNGKNKTINYCKDLIINYSNNNKNNTYINKLKEENETLKKELKESNEQINFLMYQIKELKQNKNFRPKKCSKNKKVCSPNIWKNKNIQFSLLEKEAKNELINNENDIKFNKDSLKYLNKIIGEKNYKNCKKKIIIKRKLNINRKENKKINNKNNSVCSLERPGEKIIQCISKLKI